jgi:hypothetical protein
MADLPYNVDVNNLRDPYNVGSEQPSVSEATLWTHAVFLILSSTTLLLTSLYGGIISPFLRLCKISYFNTGYAHQSHVLTVILSILFFGAMVAFPFFLCWYWTGNIDFNGFFNTLWNMIDYWRFHSRYNLEEILFWYIYPLLMWNTVFQIISALFAKAQPNLPTRTTIASHRHVFVVVAHNSSQRIEPTIRALLKLVRPHQIYVADNGSTEEQQQQTDILCANLSTEWKNSQSAIMLNDTENGHQLSYNVQVIHIPYGNKTLAQYASVYDIHQRKQRGLTLSDIITVLDDDVIVPDGWPAETIEQEFEDCSVVALGYPLSAANADKSLTAKLQDVEYINGNVGRYLFDRCGTQLFASGAISTWRADTLIHVLDRHCTVFNGEDLEMGYIVHKLSGRTDRKLGTDYPVRIGFVNNCVVPTVVPYCWIHWYDVLPYPIKRRIPLQECVCGEKSFFNQRLRSWDAAGHKYLFKWCKVLCSKGGHGYRPKMFARVLTFFKIVNLFREYFLFAGIIWSIARLRSGAEAIKLLAFYADSIFINWGLGVFYLAIQSLLVLAHINSAFRMDVCMWYIVLMDVPYTLIVRPLGVIYSLGYYVFFQRFPKDIRDQLEEDATKSNTIKGQWV